jgi:DNA repair exonuclease SbcCD ATPase subunit
VGQLRQLKAPSNLHMSEQLRELREENARLAERTSRYDSLQQQLTDAEKQVSLPASLRTCMGVKLLCVIVWCWGKGDSVF